MQQPPRRGEPEIDLEQILNRIGTALGGFRRKFGGPNRGLGGPNVFTYVVLGILGVAFIIWMATGIYTVGPGQKAALRTFGKCCKVTQENAGLQWHWPAPIGTRNVESIRQIRSLELGFRSTATVSASGLKQEAQMIAGDLNIVDVPLVVQYRIKDLEDFLFKVADPGELGRSDGDIAIGRPEGRTLKDATEAALRLVVGQRSIDDVLTERREEVDVATKELLQLILDSYQAGIQVLEVKLQETTPPEEVVDAFKM